ncbi:calcium-binding protein [Neisseriaceae bacterium B1]
MPAFDYQHYTTEQAAELAQTSYKLATYANISPKLIRESFNLIGKLGGTYFANDIHARLPAGWRDIQPQELGLPEKSVDFLGFYTIVSPRTGQVRLGLGPQAKIFGQFDETGKLVRLALSFSGTNDLLDVADYGQIQTGEIVANFTPLLQPIQEYARKNGLKSQNIIITGYSLGGAYTNMLAQQSQHMAHGYFQAVNYIAHASPYIYDAPSVLNIGFENDVVYRILGNEKSLNDSIRAGKKGWGNPDKTFANSVGNMVLFNDTYASPLWQISPFSIANIPFGWLAHIDGLTSDAIARITQSPFYRYTSRDSTIIVDNLSALTRRHTWVHDQASPTSNHANTPAFIIGNTRDNLLQGGEQGDYIDGGAGDDTIQTDIGADRIDGGSGADTVLLDGNSSEWRIYRTENGDIFAHAVNGSGIKQLNQIEYIQFKNQKQTKLDLSDNSQTIAIKSFSDSLKSNDWSANPILIGDGQNNLLNSDVSGSLIYGGEGNDIIRGNAGNDELYGAEGDDVLHITDGNDILFGGVGNDRFVFHLSSSGQSQIRDFNQYAGDNDRLIFQKNVFEDEIDVLAHTFSESDAMRIEYGNGEVWLDNSDMKAIARGVDVME